MFWISSNSFTLKHTSKYTGIIFGTISLAVSIFFLIVFLKDSSQYHWVSVLIMLVFPLLSSMPLLFGINDSAFRLEVVEQNIFYKKGRFAQVERFSVNDITTILAETSSYKNDYKPKVHILNFRS